MSFSHLIFRLPEEKQEVTTIILLHKWARNAGTTQACKTLNQLITEAQFPGVSQGPVIYVGPSENVHDLSNSDLLS